MESPNFLGLARTPHKTYEEQVQELRSSTDDEWISLSSANGEELSGRTTSRSPDAPSNPSPSYIQIPHGDGGDDCRCSEIDIHRMLDDSGSEVEVCNLNHAMQCLHCPLCKVISEVAEMYQAEHWSCRLKRSVATQDEFPQRMSIVPFARLLLILRLSPGSSSSPNLVTFDRVGVGPNYPANSQRSCLFRRPIRAAFDPNLLREWLAASDKSEAYISQAQSTQQIASFKQILLTGKFRVVDVVHDRIITVTEPVRFLALSYVWGRSMAHYAATTTCSTSVNRLDTHSKHINWSETPRTLHDAAKLTRAIGERYLWIDSLCIDQSNAEEKGLLISQMASIFANSYLTIVAADGTDADAGLSRLEETDVAEEYPVSFTAAGQSISLLPQIPGNRQAIIRSHWSSRGWTLQERLLSKRCVFFTQEQVYFQDSEIQASEAYDIQRPQNSTAMRKHAHNNESFDTVGDLYFRILEKKGLGLGQCEQAIREYTGRTLSHSGDRFDAFMGISEFFRPLGLPLEHVTALNALPLQSFANALRWEDFNQIGAPKRIRIDARNSRYLPSWSWVGWDGQVAGPLLFDTFANAATVLDSANILGKIEQAPSDFSPSLCEVSQPAAVTLHLYTKSIRCTLVQDFDEDDENFIIRIISDQDLCPVQLKDRVRLHEMPRGGWQFELAFIGRSDFWLLQCDGHSFAERLGSVSTTSWEENLRSCLIANYFRIR